VSNRRGKKEKGTLVLSLGIASKRGGSKEGEDSRVEIIKGADQGIEWRQKGKRKMTSISSSGGRKKKRVRKNGHGRRGRREKRGTIDILKGLTYHKERKKRMVCENQEKCPRFALRGEERKVFRNFAFSQTFQPEEGKEENGLPIQGGIHEIKG